MNCARVCLMSSNIDLTTWASQRHVGRSRQSMPLTLWHLSRKSRTNKNMCKSLDGKYIRIRNPVHRCRKCLNARAIAKSSINRERLRVSLTTLSPPSAHTHSLGRTTEMCKYTFKRNVSIYGQLEEEIDDICCDWVQAELPNLALA